MREMSVDVSDQLSKLTNSQTITVKPPELTHKGSLARPALFTGLALASTYGGINYDFAFNDGYITAKTLGIVAPVKLFILSNPITDFVGHNVFVGTSVAAGTALGLPLRAAYVAGRKALNPSQPWRWFREDQPKNYGHSHDHHDCCGHDNHHH